MQVVTKPARFQGNNLRAAREQIHFCVDVDPCWSVVGSGGPGDSNKGSLHKSFFMPSQELNNQLKQILEDGFEEEFIVDCAEKFEKTEFSPQTKSTARLYLFYLSGVIKSAVAEDILWERVTSQIESFEVMGDIPVKAQKLISDTGLAPEPGNIALAIGAYCYAYAAENKKSGEEFLTLFVQSWFIHWVNVPSLAFTD